MNNVNRLIIKGLPYIVNTTIMFYIINKPKINRKFVNVRYASIKILYDWIMFVTLS